MGRSQASLPVIVDDPDFYDRQGHKPPGYDPVLALQIAKLASFGLNVEQIADIFRADQVEIGSLYLGDIRQGRALGLAGVAKNIFRIARTGDGASAVNAAAFLLTSRGGWGKNAEDLTQEKAENPDDSDDPVFVDAQASLEVKLARYKKPQ